VRDMLIACQSARKKDPLSACKRDPFRCGLYEAKMFLCSADGAVSSPWPDHSKASRAAAVKHGRRPSAEPARSVLDDGEHGARLGQGGSSGSAAVETSVLVAGLDAFHRCKLVCRLFNPDRSRVAARLSEAR
jgi:hypothetical protein